MDYGVYNLRGGLWLLILSKMLRNCNSGDLPSSIDTPDTVFHTDMT